MSDTFNTHKVIRNCLRPKIFNGVLFENHKFIRNSRIFAKILLSKCNSPKKQCYTRTGYQIFVPKTHSPNLGHSRGDTSYDKVVEAMESLSCGASSLTALDKENKGNLNNTSEMSSAIDMDDEMGTQMKKKYNSSGDLVDAVVEVLKRFEQFVWYIPEQGEVDKFGRSTLPIDPEGKSYDIVCSIYINKGELGLIIY